MEWEGESDGNGPDSPRVNNPLKDFPGGESEILRDIDRDNERGDYLSTQGLGISDIRENRPSIGRIKSYRNLNRPRVRKVDASSVGISDRSGPNERHGHKRGIREPGTPNPASPNEGSGESPSRQRHGPIGTGDGNGVGQPIHPHLPNNGPGGPRSFLAKNELPSFTKTTFEAFAGGIKFDTAGQMTFTVVVPYMDSIDNALELRKANGLMLVFDIYRKRYAPS